MWVFHELGPYIADEYEIFRGSAAEVSSCYDRMSPDRARSILVFTRAACAVSGITGVALALILTPDLAARYLSPDNQLNTSTADAIDFLRSLSAVLGVGLLVFASHKRWACLSIRAIVDANFDVWPWAVLAAGIAILLSGIGVFISTTTDTPIEFLLRDPNAIAELPLYYGALEYAGIVLMAGTAGIALFSSTLSTRRPARFLMLGGLLTVWLVCDDLYMLHEQSSRVYLEQWIVFGIYGALVLAFAGTNLRYLMETPFVLLFAAGVCFASSVALDNFPGLAQLFPARLEERLELVGICFWSAYFIKCSRRALRSTPSA